MSENKTHEKYSSKRPMTVGRFLTISGIALAFGFGVNEIAKPDESYNEFFRQAIDCVDFDGNGEYDPFELAYFIENSGVGYNIIMSDLYGNPHVSFEIEKPTEAQLERVLRSCESDRERR
jgi:hypothetical protein